MCASVNTLLLRVQGERVKICKDAARNAAPPKENLWSHRDCRIHRKRTSQEERDNEQTAARKVTLHQITHPKINQQHQMTDATINTC